uniref:Cytochrome c oxidase subunit 2 n=1 Tax=Heterocerus parallelus TaxID=1587350 RepID=A0A343C1H9_9COLE|nr:cytochrome c oxidase subunit 2 [Heterocerus parallelus]
MFSTQDSASPLMEQLIMFHDHTLMILAMITTSVSLMMMSLFKNKYYNRLLLEGQMIELIWTILPAMTLTFIALPSLQLLYLIDEINNPLVSIKTMAHQWFWSYEYSDFSNIEFDSYMISQNEMKMNNFRLLDVDNRLMIPFNSQIRMMISSSDVIHSWTIPALSVKMDATPGRLNQASIIINRPSILFGQCSEICGANHSFMPISIESISPKWFIHWMKTFS